ncbi:MAG: glycosyltransferase family 4 protein [Sedimentisphaerales bacterium]|nr:glycosyltransferase family 4 protein [Sedimentisphaerales bacterium]
MARETLKIAIATPLDLSAAGGVEVHITQLALALRELGQDVTLCASGGASLGKGEVDLPFRRLGQCDLGEYDIVHTHAGGWWPSLLRRRRKWREHTRHVHTLHGVSVDYLLNCGAWHNWRCYTTTLTEGLLSHLSDHTIAVSEQIGRRARSVFGLRGDKVSVIGNGHNYRKPSSIAITAIRQRFNLSAAHNVALFIGRSEDKVKGAAAVVSAFDELAERFGQLRLLAVPGTKFPQRSWLLRSGPVQHGEICEFYAASDLLVNASLNEGMPLTVIEAMAAGLPVVASPVGGIPEIVRHDVTGLLTNRKRTNLAEQIERLLTDEELAQRLADAGQELAGELTWGKIAERTLEVYHEAANRRG